jgi:Spy/CpxP family protein refolding chaperone
MNANHKKRALTFGVVMSRGIVITCLIGLVAATAAGAADTNAPPPSSAPAHHPKGTMVVLPPRVLEDLALTPEQQANYDALAAGFKKDLAKWCADNNYDLEKAREEMGQARQAGDQATIQKLTDQRKGLVDLRKSYVDKVRAFLTDEQKATLDKALEHAHDWSGGHGPSGVPPSPQPPPADK